MTTRRSFIPYRMLELVDVVGRDGDVLNVAATTFTISNNPLFYYRLLFRYIFVAVGATVMTTTAHFSP